MRMAANSEVLNPPFFLFLLAASATALLILLTFSAPFIPVFYVLYTSAEGGLQFGTWGWCVDVTGGCTPAKFGWSFDPYFIPHLTKLFILFPVAAALSLISTLTLLPLLCTRSVKWYPYPPLAVLSLLSALSCSIAFGASAVTFIVAQNRLRHAGFEASVVHAPCIWMAVGATTALLVLAVNSSCGTFCRGTHGRRSHRRTYKV